MFSSKFNSLILGGYGNDFKSVISKFIIQDSSSDTREITPRRMSQNIFDDKSLFVQIMSWCRQATIHYLNQFWPRSKSLCAITSTQRINWSSMSMCHIDELVQKLRNSIANALELRLYCTNPSIYKAQPRRSRTTTHILVRHMVTSTMTSWHGKTFRINNGAHVTSLKWWISKVHNYVLA